MRTELKEIQQRTGTTFLYVTHDQSEAITMSDNIAVMNNGRIIQIGHPEVIYNRPANTFVADFIGAGNFIPLEHIDIDSQPHVLTTIRGGRILLKKNTSEEDTSNITNIPQHANEKINISDSDNLVRPVIKKTPVFFIRPEKIKISIL